jgi:predicted ATPase/DNA-binding NarL/FixJ family response regulator
VTGCEGLMAVAGRVTLGNLPAELTSFVGRRRELGEVKRLLAESRLLTLTGIGGTGKTRLAVRAGAELRRAFGDGVWFVDLTELRGAVVLTQNLHDPDVLAFLVTATLGLRERGDGSPLQVLAGQLVDRQMLLIMDNCEHLIPASAVVADALLRGCPGLRILATSREPLTITGEALFAVPPLPAPDLDRRTSLAELGRYEAVALFLARARASVPGFGLTEDNHLAVAALCHRVDGLPLAIELAAARIRVLAPEQILERLTDGFALLTRGSRTAPGRQQTLRACVDWSFDLCTKPERMLWARLSVFVGGFELQAVEGVCADERLPEAELLELVAGLVDKSILVCDDGRGEAARYRMLEAIRHYGLDKLREAGEDAVLRRRHRDWHQRLAARADAGWISDRQTYWLARLGREHANLRAAVEFCLTEPGEAEAALRLAVSLPWVYWNVRGLFGEVRRWLDRALAQATAPTALRARALLVYSYLAFSHGDTPAGMRLLDEGEELARRLDAGAEVAYADYLRGMGAHFANDLPVAVEILDRARTALSAAPDRDLDLYLNVLVMLGSAAALAGDLERATSCVQEILAVVEPRGGGLHRSLALWTGGLIAWLRGDLSQATAQELESLRLKRAWASDDRYGVALCLEVLAWITADQHRHRRAATLLGAADTLWTDVGASITSFGHFIGHRMACERQTRDALGEAAFADAYHHGRVLEYDSVLAYALDETRQPAPAPQVGTSTSLTRREQQVADLIAQGQSNKDIAARLVISQRTAESHVEHILTKLGFTSRAQVAAWKATQQFRNQDP